jgi:hypothetical protein
MCFLLRKLATLLNRVACKPSYKEDCETWRTTYPLYDVWKVVEKKNTIDLEQFMKITVVKNPTVITYAEDSAPPEGIPTLA